MVDVSCKMVLGENSNLVNFLAQWTSRYPHVHIGMIPGVDCPGYFAVDGVCEAKGRSIGEGEVVVDDSNLSQRLVHPKLAEIWTKGVLRNG